MEVGGSRWLYHVGRTVKFVLSNKYKYMYFFMVMMPDKNIHRH